MKDLEEDSMEQQHERKPYEEPAVVYEAPLEVRAGSTFPPPPIMPDGLGGK